MQSCLSRIFAGIFALTTFSLLGCSSSNSLPGAGGSSGGEVTHSGGVSAGGTTTNTTDTGGASPSGGTTSSGGESQAGSVSQGGSDTGGAVTSAAGQTAPGGSSGSETGGSETGGSAAAGSETGGSTQGGSAAGGSATGGGVSGGKTATGGVSTGGAGTAGKTSTGGSTGTTGGSTGTTGGSATGGKTATGGTTTGGTTGGTSGSGSTGKITVWMAGDSTMSGSGCTGGGWGDQFGSCFNSNVTVVNKSVAGRSIQTWLYEKNVSSTMDTTTKECPLIATTYSDNWNTMLTGMKAGDWLLVEFGINDGNGTCPRHVGTTLFQTYLTTMAKAATDRGAHPIFLTSTSAVACNGATAQANRGFGPQTKAAGTADNVPVIDMTVLSAALYTSAGLCPNNNDYSSTTSKVGLFFCNDHTHFEAAGALQIAKTAAQALKDQNIPLAAYLVN
jgi:lysophospholipase L1-like esterase